MELFVIQRVQWFCHDILQTTHFFVPSFCNPFPSVVRFLVQPLHRLEHTEQWSTRGSPTPLVYFRPLLPVLLTSTMKSSKESWQLNIRVQRNFKVKMTLFHKWNSRSTYVPGMFSTEPIHPSYKFPFFSCTSTVRPNTVVQFIDRLSTVLSNTVSLLYIYLPNADYLYLTNALLHTDELTSDYLTTCPYFPTTNWPITDLLITNILTTNLLTINLLTFNLLTTELLTVHRLLPIKLLVPTTNLMTTDILTTSNLPTPGLPTTVLPCTALQWTSLLLCKDTLPPGSSHTLVILHGLYIIFDYLWLHDLDKITVLLAEFPPEGGTQWWPHGQHAVTTLIISSNLFGSWSTRQIPGRHES
jgi:hypothetical protein